MEEQMSSAYYHEGLAYVTQHHETFSGPTTYNHSCAWDPDCLPGCYATETCNPLAAAGYDGGKVPGTYFGSPKGLPGLPEFPNFIMNFYLILTMKTSGRAVIPVQYKGPSTPEGAWDFEGLFAHSTFKAAGWTRRLENCNYKDGRMVGEAKDSRGIDCDYVKDTSPLTPYFGLPLFWAVMVRDFAPVGWDPALVNADDGASFVMQDQISIAACTGNPFCTTNMQISGDPSYTTLLHYGYEPNLGALVDVVLTIGVSWKLTVTPFYGALAGFKHVPLTWIYNYLHLPAAINMDLSKLQGIPAALNGFYIFLLAQCMISLVGGVTCCFCGV
jgi:hypothetical protein